MPPLPPLSLSNNVSFSKHLHLSSSDSDVSLAIQERVIVGFILILMESLCSADLLLEYQPFINVFHHLL